MIYLPEYSFYDFFYKKHLFLALYNYKKINFIIFIYIVFL